MKRLVPTIVLSTQFVVLEVVLRGKLLQPLALFASVCIWAGLAGVATTRARRVAIGLVAAVLLVVQAFVFRFFHTPLDLQVAEATLHSWHDVRKVLVRVLPYALVSIAIVTVLEASLLRLAWRPPRWVFAGALVLVFVDPRRATPDIGGVHAMRALVGEKPPAMEGAIALPALHSDVRESPSILFVFSESIRAQDYDASTAPGAYALANRVDFDGMRTVTSYSAVSLSAVLTGRVQNVPREEILRAPNLFDFAHAAGLHVEYWSAHERDVFETKDVRAAVNRFFTLEDLVGHEIEDDAAIVEMPLDKMLIDRFLADALPKIPPASVTMVHLASTHVPYYFDDARAVFKPFDRSVAWSQLPLLRNGYKNAILEQDTHVARLVHAFIEHAGNHPWLVVFTSDHGEAFGDHGAIHHGQNLYEEQIHVPAWMAGTALGRVNENASKPVTQLDLLPTMLDALGLWDNFSVAPYRARIEGKSLFRAWEARPPLAITNCTGMFKCPLNTWGELGSDRKLTAQVWDAAWRCTVIGGTNEEAAPPEDPGCAALLSASRRDYPLMPNGEANR